MEWLCVAVGVSGAWTRFAHASDHDLAFGPPLGRCKGAFPFLPSTALLAEYREVLLRKKIHKLHGLSERDVEALLVALATNAIVREPEPRTGAPDTNDDHLWSLVQSETNCVLVTGDQALAKARHLGPLFFSRGNSWICFRSELGSRLRQRNGRERFPGGYDLRRASNDAFASRRRSMPV
jgi:hypothetical protein